MTGIYSLMTLSPLTWTFSTLYLHPPYTSLKRIFCLEVNSNGDFLTPPNDMLKEKRDLEERLGEMGEIVLLKVIGGVLAGEYLKFEELLHELKIITFDFQEGKLKLTSKDTKLEILIGCSRDLDHYMVQRAIFNANSVYEKQSCNKQEHPSPSHNSPASRNLNSDPRLDAIHLTTSDNPVTQQGFDTFKPLPILPVMAAPTVQPLPTSICVPTVRVLPPDSEVSACTKTLYALSQVTSDHPEEEYNSVKPPITSISRQEKYRILTETEYQHLKAQAAKALDLEAKLLAQEALVADIIALHIRTTYVFNVSIIDSIPTNPNITFNENFTSSNSSFKVICPIPEEKEVRKWAKDKWGVDLMNTNKWKLEVMGGEVFDDWRRTELSVQQTQGTAAFDKAHNPSEIFLVFTPRISFEHTPNTHCTVPSSKPMAQNPDPGYMPSSGPNAKSNVDIFAATSIIRPTLASIPTSHRTRAILESRVRSRTGDCFAVKEFDELQNKYVYIPSSASMSNPFSPDNLPTRRNESWIPTLEEYRRAVANARSSRTSVDNTATARTEHKMTSSKSEDIVFPPSEPLSHCQDFKGDTLPFTTYVSETGNGTGTVSRLTQPTLLLVGRNKSVSNGNLQIFTNPTRLSPPVTTDSPTPSSRDISPRSQLRPQLHTVPSSSSSPGSPDYFNSLNHVHYDASADIMSNSIPSLSSSTTLISPPAELIQTPVPLSFEGGPYNVSPTIVQALTTTGIFHPVEDLKENTSMMYPHKIKGKGKVTYTETMLSDSSCRAECPSNRINGAE
nr:hypothetical protein L203_00183 [Cryptococcus depauperatus CBS 7841]